MLDLNDPDDEDAKDILDEHRIPEDLDEEKKEKLREMLREGRNFQLRDWTARLLREHPLFAALSRRIEKKRSRNIPTAGVQWSSDRMNFRLLYNPYFMANLDTSEKLAVLKHEFYHCLLRHVTSRMNFDPEENKQEAKRWNVATDCAINSMPDVEKDIPDFALHPDQFNLPPQQSAEWYRANISEEDMEEMTSCPICGGDGEISPDQDGQNDENPEDGEGGSQQAQEEGQQQESDGEGDGQHDHGTTPCPHCQGSGDGQFDEHKWGDSQNDSDRAMAEEEIKRISREAREELAKKDRWGTVPEHLKKIIDELLESQIDWRRQLQYFVEKTQICDRHRTIKRPNRKKPYRPYHPGYRVERESKLAISVDQSGSVSDEMLAHFFSELASLSDRVSFTVVPFDVEVVEDEIFEWDKNEIPDIKRVAQGGTNFEAPTKWVNNHGGFDGHIIMSDMYAPQPQDSTARRAWVKPKHCDPHFNTDEMVIEIDADRLE